MMKLSILTFLLSALAACANPLLTFNPANCIPYLDEPGYCRVDYQWFINNTGQASTNYQNGLIRNDLTETGTYDANILEAWQTQPNANGVIVGVIDTGSDPNHPDMQGVVIAGRYISNRGNINRDEISNYDWHGPGICGIIAANNNSIGIRGVASGAKLVVVSTPLSLEETPRNIADSIDWCLSVGAKIICLSWGETSVNDPYLFAAMARAQAANVVIVSALGYTPNVDTTPTYPYGFNFPNYIPVVALKRDGSMFVQTIASRAIGAPGRVIIMPHTDGGYGYSSGSSFAAPIVAGTLALLLKNDPMSAAQMVGRLKSSSSKSPLTGIIGRLDAYDVLNK